MPDQELRFSTFRERKSLIERDVVRSDRSHPFYADNSTNLSNLTTLLMTYMMYDFDIGYLQGMSDLAAPILYVFKGDLVKSFWVFVEVMKLFRRNFEYSQKSIHFQLNCLYRLIRLTDPKLAHYLSENECSNCFFAFRCIVCQFKRELMTRNNDNNIDNNKINSNNNNNADENIENNGQDYDDYAKVLSLWDTIWSVQRRHELLSKSNCIHTFTIANGKNSSTKKLSLFSQDNHLSPRHNPPNQYHNQKQRRDSPNVGAQTVVYTKETFYSSFDPNQADVPRFELTETEKFVLSLCLSLIRRERNRILLCRMDASEIHQHFINPQLASDLDNFIGQAYEIYQFLNTDCDLQRLVRGANGLSGDAADLSPLNGGSDIQIPDTWQKDSGTPDTYDLLKDYLIISPTS